jgi:hypothetical protein
VVDGFHKYRSSAQCITQYMSLLFVQWLVWLPHLQSCRHVCRTCVSQLLLVSVAQVRQHPENAPAWRLLGTVHAENDDDRQVGACWPVVLLCR